MELLSITNSKLRLHASPSDLSTVCEQSHAQKDCNYSDFTLLPLPRSFMQISKDTKSNSCCFNLFRLKTKDDKEFFDLIQKRKGDNINCASFCKNPKEQHLNLQYSVGHVSGKIKTLDLNNKVVSEFAAPSTPSSVIFLDYNSVDENLASVYESGVVNIYGMQTSVKLDTYNVDNQSTLARFHPNKRSHLAIASYRGGVSVIDIFAKKTIFKNEDAHKAPCSDVLMSDSMLFSSGYDTTIKIFDLRKKSFGMKIQGSYGWTSLALSKCGVYFIGGNMKGEITTYDVRNFKKPLAKARVESGGNQKITRVAFLPNSGSDVLSPIDISSAVRQSLCPDSNNEPEDTNDGFIEEIVGFHKGRISDFSSSIAFGSRVSTVSNRASLDEYKDDMFAVNTVKSPFDSPAEDSRVNKSRRRASVNTSVRFSQPLQDIHEELPHDKENDTNLMNVHTPVIDVRKGPRYSSTPSIPVQENPPFEINDCEEEVVDVIEIDDSFKSAKASDVQDGEKSKKSADAPEDNFNLRKEFDNLAEKIRFEIQSMNFDEDRRYVNLVFHMTDQRSKLQERVQLIEESMALLMNDDYKINRILELQNENAELRRQLFEMARRMSH